MKRALVVLIAIKILLASSMAVAADCPVAHLEKDYFYGTSKHAFNLAMEAIVARDLALLQKLWDRKYIGFTKNRIRVVVLDSSMRWIKVRIFGTQFVIWTNLNAVTIGR